MRVSRRASFGTLFVLLAMLALSVSACSNPLDGPSIRSDASLSALTVDSGTLKPDFSPTTLFYTLDLAYEVSKLTVTGTATQLISTVTNPTAETSLTAGTTQVLEISVVAADQKTTMVYEVSVTRAAAPVTVTPPDPTDASLKALTVITGTLSPAFDPLVTDYTVSLPYTVTKFSATGVASNSAASVTNPPFTSKLVSGATQTFEVTVLAADQKTTKVYRIVVTVDPRPAMLSGISVSFGALSPALSPAFSPDVHDYQVTVVNSVTSVTVTGTASDSRDSVTGPDVLAGLIIGQPQVSTLTVSGYNASSDYRVTVTKSDLAVLPTVLNVSLTGDDASLFKLELANGTSAQPRVQNSPSSWTIDLAGGTQDLAVNAFIDRNANSVRDIDELRVCSWYTLTEGQTLSETIQLGKTVLSMLVTGDTSIFTHPMYINNRNGSGSSSPVVAAISAPSMVVYGDLMATFGSTGYLSVFDDLNDNQQYDRYEPIISTAEVTWNYEAAVTASLTLMANPPQVLGAGKRVEIGAGASQFYPQDMVHYRFIFRGDRNDYVFVLPTGLGTDGSFITCYQCEVDPPRSDWHSGDHLWSLLLLAYGNDDSKLTEAINNYDQQLVAWKQNVKDVVTYLESVKGLTIYGKELLPSDW